jgi:hypothetical protein
MSDGIMVDVCYWRISIVNWRQDTISAHYLQMKSWLVQRGSRETCCESYERKYMQLHPPSLLFTLILSSQLGLHFPVVSSIWACVQPPTLHSDPNRVTWRAWLHARFCSMHRFLICPVHHSFCTAELRCPHSFELSCILLIRETISL